MNNITVCQILVFQSPNIRNKMFFVVLGLSVGIIKFFPVSLVHLELLEQSFLKPIPKGYTHSIVYATFQHRGVVSILCAIVIAEVIWFVSIYFPPFYVLVLKPHVWSCIYMPCIIIYFFIWFYRSRYLQRKTEIQIWSRNEVLARDYKKIPIYFVTTLLLQLSNPLVHPHATYSRLIGVYLFRYSHIKLFMISTFIGLISGPILFVLMAASLIALLRRIVPSIYSGILTYADLILQSLYIYLLLWVASSKNRASVLVRNAGWNISPRDIRLRDPWPSLIFDVSQPRRGPTYGLYHHGLNLKSYRNLLRSPIFSKLNKHCFSQYYFAPVIAHGKLKLSYNFPIALAESHRIFESMLYQPYYKINPVWLHRTWLDQKLMRRKLLMQVIRRTGFKLRTGFLIKKLRYHKLCTAIKKKKAISWYPLKKLTFYWLLRHAKIGKRTVNRKLDPRLSSYKRSRSIQPSSALLHHKIVRGYDPYEVVDPSDIDWFMNRYRGYKVEVPPQAFLLSNRIQDMFLLRQLMDLKFHVILPWTNMQIDKIFKRIYHYIPDVCKDKICTNLVRNSLHDLLLRLEADNIELNWANLIDYFFLRKRFLPLGRVKHIRPRKRRGNKIKRLKKYYRGVFTTSRFIRKLLKRNKIRLNRGFINNPKVARIIVSLKIPNSWNFQSWSNFWTLQSRDLTKFLQTNIKFVRASLNFLLGKTLTFEWTPFKSQTCRDRDINAVYEALNKFYTFYKPFPAYNTQRTHFGINQKRSDFPTIHNKTYQRVLSAKSNEYRDRRYNKFTSSRFINRHQLEVIPNLQTQKWTKLSYMYSLHPHIPFSNLRNNFIKLGWLKQKISLQILKDLKRAKVKRIVWWKILPQMKDTRPKLTVPTVPSLLSISKHFFRSCAILLLGFIRRLIVLPALILFKDFLRTQLLKVESELGEDWLALKSELYVYTTYPGDSYVESDRTQFVSLMERYMRVIKTSVTETKLKTKSKLTNKNLKARSKKQSKGQVDAQSRRVLERERVIDKLNQDFTRVTKTVSEKRKFDRFNNYGTYLLDVKENIFGIFSTKLPADWWFKGLQLRVIKPVVLHIWRISKEDKYQLLRNKNTKGQLTRDMIDDRDGNYHYLRQIRLEGDNVWAPFLNVQGKMVYLPPPLTPQTVYQFPALLKDTRCIIAVYWKYKIYPRVANFGNKIATKIVSFIPNILLLRIKNLLSTNTFLAFSKKFNFVVIWFKLDTADVSNSTKKEKILRHKHKRNLSLQTLRDSNNVLDSLVDSLLSSLKVDLRLSRIKKIKVQKQKMRGSLLNAESSVRDRKLVEPRIKMQIASLRYQKCKKKYFVTNLFLDWKNLFYFPRLRKFDSNNLLKLMRYKKIQIQIFLLNIEITRVRIFKFIKYWLQVEIPLLRNRERKLFLHKIRSCQLFLLTLYNRIIWYSVFKILDFTELINTRILPHIQNITNKTTAFILKDLKDQKRKSVNESEDLSPNLELRLTKASILKEIWETNFFTNPVLQIIDKEWTSNKVLKSEIKRILEKEGILNIDHSKQFLNKAHWLEWLKVLPRFKATDEIAAIVWPDKHRVQSICLSKVNISDNKKLFNSIANWCRLWGWYRLLRAYISPDHGVRIQYPEDIPLRFKVQNFENNDYIFAKNLQGLDYPVQEQTEAKQVKFHPLHWFFHRNWKISWSDMKKKYRNIFLCHPKKLLSSTNDLDNNTKIGTKPTPKKTLLKIPVRRVDSDFRKIRMYTRRWKKANFKHLKFKLIRDVSAQLKSKPSWWKIWLAFFDTPSIDPLPVEYLNFDETNRFSIQRSSHEWIMSVQRLMIQNAIMDIESEDLDLDEDDSNDDKDIAQEQLEALKEAEFLWIIKKKFVPWICNLSAPAKAQVRKMLKNRYILPKRRRYKRYGRRSRLLFKGNKPSFIASQNDPVVDHLFLPGFFSRMRLASFLSNRYEGWYSRILDLFVNKIPISRRPHWSRNQPILWKMWLSIFDMTYGKYSKKKQFKAIKREQRGVLRFRPEGDIQIGKDEVKSNTRVNFYAKALNDTIQAKPMPRSQQFNKLNFTRKFKKMLRRVPRLGVIRQMWNERIKNNILNPQTIATRKNILVSREDLMIPIPENELLENMRFKSIPGNKTTHLALQELMLTMSRRGHLRPILGWQVGLIKSEQLVHSILYSLYEYNSKDQKFTNKRDSKILNFFKMLEINKYNNRLPFFIFDDILPPAVIRELRVLRTLKLQINKKGVDNFSLDTRFYFKIMKDNSLQNKTKLIRDYGIIKRFLWAPHRFEDLACMNRFGLGTHKQSKQSVLIIDMYPETKD